MNEREEIEMVNKKLIPRLKKEFGVKKKIPRKGLIDKLLLSKYEYEFDWSWYDKAWMKLEFRLYKINGLANKKCVDKLINEVIKELKNEAS